MTRSSFIVAAALLVAPLSAQPSGAVGSGGRVHSSAAGDPSSAAIAAAEPLSRAQIAQLIADQGYFEIADLTRRSDGLWTCTALRGPGERVTLTVDPIGHIAESAAK